MLKKVLANRRSQSLIVSTASDPAMLDSSKSKIQKTICLPKLKVVLTALEGHSPVVSQPAKS